MQHIISALIVASAIYRLHIADIAICLTVKQDINRETTDDRDKMALTFASVEPDQKRAATVARVALTASHMREVCGEDCYLASAVYLGEEFDHHFEQAERLLQHLELLDIDCDDHVVFSRMDKEHKEMMVELITSGLEDDAEQLIGEMTYAADTEASEAAGAVVDDRPESERSPSSHANGAPSA